jgi:capsular exopolysaccharide synthesis family protein
VRQHLVLVIVIALVCGALGFFVGIAAPKTYTASRTLVLIEPPGLGGSPNAAARYTASQAQFANTDAVLKQVVPTAKVSLADLRKDVGISTDPNSDAISVSCSLKDRVVAANCANKLGDAVTAAIAAHAAGVRTASLTMLDGLIKNAKAAAVASGATQGEQAAALSTTHDLELQEVSINKEAARFGTGVLAGTVAQVPDKTGVKSAILFGAVGFILGALIGVLIAWVLADRRRVIDDASVPGLVTGARLLGEVPVLRGGVARPLTRFPDMPAAPFEFVAAGLWSSLESGVILVSGVEHGAGSTTTTANIAAAFARDGRRVLAIDADCSQRSLSRLAGIHDDSAGLSDVLTRRAPLEDSLRAVELGDSTSVAVLPAGKAEADMASLLRAKTMTETMERLRDWYDLIVIDAPPLTTDAEGASIARSARVDGVVCVIARSTRLRVVERLRERLALLEVPVLGYVFNRDQAPDLGVARGRAGSRA